MTSHLADVTDGSVASLDVNDASVANLDVNDPKRASDFLVEAARAAAAEVSCEAVEVAPREGALVVLELKVNKKNAKPDKNVKRPQKKPKELNEKNVLNVQLLVKEVNAQNEQSDLNVVCVENEESVVNVLSEENEASEENVPSALSERNVASEEREEPKVKEMNVKIVNREEIDRQLLKKLNPKNEINELKGVKVLLLTPMLPLKSQLETAICLI